MKYLIGIVALVAVIGGGYYFLTQTSVVPEGVDRAVVADDSSGANGTASSSLASGDSAGSSQTTADSSFVAENIKFSFTGYGPGGKEHEGTFASIAASDVVTGSDGLPASGRVALKVDTVSTGIAGLDKDLCSDNFFNCARYPEITFTYKNAVEAAGVYAVTGTLAFNGNSKDISFPVRRTAPLSFSSDFLLDTTPFKFKYVGINKDVRIQFSFDLASKN